MDLIKKTNVDFVSRRNLFFMTSIIVNIVGLILVLILGIDYGIDFEGGTEVKVAFRNNTVQAEDLRSAIGSIGYKDAEIKTFGGAGQYLVRIQATGKASEVSAQIVSELKRRFPKENVELLGADNVEKKISNELFRDSLIALTVAFLAIMLFVSLRFEWVFGLGSIVALLHDVLMAFVISVLFNKLGWLNLELNINSIAAYLTIIGYSINDKVVVFDRIRENREKHKGMSLSQLVNLSLNETLSRTILTGVAVLAALLVMVFFGGSVLEGFAFTMFIGIVIGTYSSIYIATSFVIWYTDRVKHKNVGTVVRTTKA